MRRRTDDMSRAHRTGDAPLIDRRAFLGRTLLAIATPTVARVAEGQAPQPAQTMSGPMRGEAYRPVTLPPRANATPQVSLDRRDDLEKHLKCQCGCPLDIYTCRTTDFACPVSPRVHADIQTLIAGGYTDTEIREAFIAVYGERVLTAPTPQGFNLLAYVAPFAAITVFGAFAAWVIHRWRREPVPDAEVHARIPQSAGTPEEIARIDAAVRNDAS
jgi:cytochrome c-type biogenesis protein CcmH